eukprot:TRINITY_DN8822_c0_g1_i1.p1 TRINITY_DN8822_c0_g1~~TRINITY_DN8822_c0_g1_i1.p1  ORF type:complete len:447 (+),score=84.99 TRINITY_DN8822_c0_g1_i1:44-1342(+)
MVNKNWKTLTDSQLALAITSPKSCNEILKVVSKMNDRQLKIVFPLMSGEHIKRVIPQMQLEKQGVAVSVMNSSQVRDCVSAIPKGDRQLLLQNISLIANSKLSDQQQINELSSFISFIDPLAMAVAVENQDLVDKVIEVTSIMTPQQIRVIIPLLSLPKIVKAMQNIESDDCFDVAMEMLSVQQKEDLTLLFEKQRLEVEAQLLDYQVRTDKISDIDLSQLRKDITNFCEIESFSPELKLRYRELMERLKQIKSQIESLQQNVRYTQKQIKLPLKIVSERENEELHRAYASISATSISLSRQLHANYVMLSNTNQKEDLIEMLNGRWHGISSSLPDDSPLLVQEEISSGPRPGSIPDCNAEELVFVDDDLSVGLYEAVKTLGNPETFGDIYKISWEDIIKCGFRKEKDFTEKGIRNLKDLEGYIARVIHKAS